MLGVPRPYATLSPDQPLEVVVETRDGSRALVVGKLRSVPESAGGQAIRIVVTEATARPLVD